MRWIDLLRMSSSNLKRRKLRTFLTVLGVVIGVASIVVMVSLGLGLKQSLYRELEQSGGLTGITVSGKEVGSSMIYYSDDDGEESNKYITDETIQELQELEHVKCVSPTLEMSSILLKGNYYGYIQLMGLPREELARQNMKMVPGSSLPKENSASLDLVIGNGIPTMFYEKGTNRGYWDTQELPDIDFMNDSMFLVLDQDAYFSSQSSGLNVGDTGEGSGDGSGATSQKPPKKYVVHASGMVDGGVDVYTANYYYVYCDIDVLKSMLKKEYAGRVIPGQPSTKTGKPYRFFAYSSAKIQADNMENVEELSRTIQNMGYRVSTNAEYMESAQKELVMVEAVLGGIGAISLLVAAIGIANTMMMSIYERTKEIGVIKVLGCSLKNIKQMFLLEAAYIGFAGGLVGNILSFLLSGIINMLTGNGSAMGLDGDISYIPLWLVAVSMLFAIFVGMAAGYFPALRAMRLSPLAAIRNE
ncbi:MAG: ABC transporter permease [Hespellia sp.]|jgi:ABC-type antimicrobial peptide transport system permease subunit|nr:ABC transporter permease [Hespellia sp.]